MGDRNDATFGRKLGTVLFHPIQEKRKRVDGVWAKEPIDIQTSVETLESTLTLIRAARSQCKPVPPIGQSLTSAQFETALEYTRTMLLKHFILNKTLQRDYQLFLQDHKRFNKKARKLFEMNFEARTGHGPPSSWATGMFSKSSCAMTFSSRRTKHDLRGPSCRNEVTGKKPATIHILLGLRR